jgi:hypothetical protein
MANRTLVGVVPSTRTLEGGGFQVRRPFPTQRVDHVDPFLLLDEMGPQDHAPGAAKGAPDHPHRGFETVTYLLEGSFEHADSMGSRGVLNPGDVQWMTAGSGVIHSEMPTEPIRRNGGRLHGFQLWVNLPAKDKMMRPRYQDVPSARIPVVEQGGVRVKVIAGESMGAKAVIDTRIPILYLHVTLQPRASFETAVPADHNAFVYVFRGRATVAEAARTLEDGDMGVLGQDGDTLRLTNPGDAPMDALVLGAVPLREPVARYGPFVMNTREELVTAFEDYREGRFGKIAAVVG